MKEANSEVILHNEDNPDEPPTERKQITGKIIKVSDEGWGFITSRDIPFTRIFFHWSALRPDTLRFIDIIAGMRVSCEAFLVPNKGYRAIKIKIED